MEFNSSVIQTCFMGGKNIAGQKVNIKIIHLFAQTFYLFSGVIEKGERLVPGHHQNSNKRWLQSVSILQYSAPLIQILCSRILDVVSQSLLPENPDSQRRKEVGRSSDY